MSKFDLSFALKANITFLSRRLMTSVFVVKISLLSVFGTDRKITAVNSTNYLNLKSSFGPFVFANGSDYFLLVTKTCQSRKDKTNLP